MRLAEFINTQRAQILAEWDTFASTLAPASDTMGVRALRDHANEMLSVIAKDLETPQTLGQQHQKAIGNAPADAQLVTAAEQHGADRAERGFSIDQMVSEYRALRASVIRLWIETTGSLEKGDIEDLMRFNEAIDQSLAESIARYTVDLAHSREMFIAILGHDLRTPLGAITMASEFMLETGELAEPHLSLTTRVASSARRMDRMVRDLLDLTLSRLGTGIPIERDWMDLDDAVREAVSELTSTHPDRSIDVRASGDLRGRWDRGRLGQVFANLIGNALDHGARGMPVKVTIEGESDAVVIAVHNHGPPIPSSQLQTIFKPMTRSPGKEEPDLRGSAHLGLGLYIAERIVTAHCGQIEPESSASGTTFTVHLPRKPIRPERGFRPARSQSAAGPPVPSR